MNTLTDLANTIAERAKADPESSWTAKLLAKGPEKCAEKFGEEAIEAIIEAVKDNREGLISESADVLFHLLVMLQSRNVALDEVLNELARRQGTSGIAEKASRPKA
ncbi:phosphoribosyl-ATP diphosphatase [Shimia thalassica]|mgnify:CR=1 FL=1|uniref:phosphoribosyl-ATP diphosphatase n=1 Tax=Shimia thalassica TaxID=1715693 RepID=UPI000C084781|nr:phosphoribosyl-ATP diphosphatase [Shimia thalassica]MBU2942083.1 phosphoribosyl-ATP diphosphatase [Shimia thalassica]MDO6502948.1 phosphoribosyl-ATP diphosphatase [Shimia thalassica]PHO03574.1 phosphoribosyl-ATP diphosphatase [Rhodobacteraceae bacterium 4F10]